MKKFIFRCPILALLLVACQLRQAPPSPLPITWLSPTPIRTHLSFSLTPSLSPTPTQTFTSTNKPYDTTRPQTPTKTASRTITLSSTTSLSPATSNTPWPDEYIAQRYMELFETNGNCRLPCWWGVEPGKTTKDEARQLFAPFKQYDRILFDETGGSSYATLIMSPPVPRDYTIMARLEFDSNGIVQTIDLDAETFMYCGFSPTKLLADYGNPDKVLLPPGLLVMFYEKQHILAEYAITQDKDTHQACFSAFNSLFTWTPSENWTLQDVQRELHISSLKEWEEVTDQRIDVFYEAFETWKGTKNCFQLLPDAWP